MPPPPPPPPPIRRPRRLGARGATHQDGEETSVVTESHLDPSEVDWNAASSPHTTSPPVSPPRLPPSHDAPPTLWGVLREGAGGHGAPVAFWTALSNLTGAEAKDELDKCNPIYVLALSVLVLASLVASVIGFTIGRYFPVVDAPRQKKNTPDAAASSCQTFEATTGPRLRISTQEVVVTTQGERHHLK